MAQTLLQSYQSPDPAISVLKGVDMLKLRMKCDYVEYSNSISAVVLAQQGSHPARHILRFGCFLSTDHIRPALIISNRKPAQCRVLRVVLEYIMQMLYDFLCQFLLRIIDHIVDGTEMMNSFQNIIDRNTITHINCICLENHPCLVFRKLASFDVVGVVGHPHLKLMIKTA